MEQLPSLSDREVALEMRALIERSHSPSQQAKQILQARPGIVDVSLPDRYLIHDAVNRTSCGDPSWVAELLKCGADPNARSKSGDPAIFWVCKSYKAKPAAYLQALQYLVHAGGDINFLNDQKPEAEGQTALIMAVNTSRLWDEDNRMYSDEDRQTRDLVVACLGYGANVNASDTSGRTALHWAVMSGNVLIVLNLLNAGADPEMKDLKQRGVLDWWTHQRNKATLHCLKKNMHPKHFETKATVKPTDDNDSEVDSEDEVDQRKELKTYFPDVPGTVRPGYTAPTQIPEISTTLSQEQERMVERLMWWSAKLQWSKEKCRDGLEKCNWDFNAVIYSFRHRIVVFPLTSLLRQPATYVPQIVLPRSQGVNYC